MFQTETSSINVLTELGWSMTASNFQSFELLNLLPPGEVRTIESGTHLAMVEESLQNHADIWRSLAER